MKIPVLEIFGPTIQGEGAVIGKKTVFIRTAGCDYQCSWCDSAYTWDGSGKADIQMLSCAEIMAELEKIGYKNFKHVTISGGNPALIKQIAELIVALHKLNIKVGLETQGSVWQDWMLEVDDLTISPKPPSSGMKTDVTCLQDIIERLAKRVNKDHVSLKVVIFNENDLSYAKAIHQRFPDVPFFLQVGNSDLEVEKAEDLAFVLLQKLAWLVDKVVTDRELNEVRVLPQLHALLWGNKREV
ncbi:7-carboxy-7-deazaguanine synthase QueE [Bacillaceae bacterium IKA-2]|nr:7-carboxy-7-deazaguanine synthase QueE [Bacillaceae bacterium IKA-2]